ncbi:HAD-like domain-containing protein [Jimgerdemannia flammicorona]|uniref:Mitochondrial import inner membrane translocase subunit TIM50 n=1 Tax=Jimgerdemannia flammicorona TaxID=994334 RepID=A0A433QXY8_9FUNG|nr:HAD-like domain-containing protein [Jimgerdemannia flammicorona]
MTRLRAQPPHRGKRSKKAKTKLRRQRRPTNICYAPDRDAHHHVRHHLHGLYDVEAKLEELDDYECALLRRLMNDNWPSLRWRLKYCRANGKPLLPKKTDDKLTVVLDLDETLLHTYHDSDAKPSQLDYSVAVPVPLPIPDYDAQCVVHGSLRPGVTQFLEWAASMFELVVWTAGTKWYAEAIVNKLDPERRLISHVLSQKHCIELEVISGVACYLKDLELLGRDLRRTVIVDNTPHDAIPSSSSFSRDLQPQQPDTHRELFWV